MGHVRQHGFGDARVGRPTPETQGIKLLECRLRQRQPLRQRQYAVKSTYALALLEPYLDAGAPELNQAPAKPRFEDMVAKAQQSVVLILVY
jgi:hypothetical protein